MYGENPFLIVNKKAISSVLSIPDFKFFRITQTRSHPSILPDLIFRCIRKFEVGNPIKFPCITLSHMSIWVGIQSGRIPWKSQPCPEEKSAWNTGCTPGQKSGKPHIELHTKKWFEDGDFRKPRKLYVDFYRCMDFEYIGHLFYLLSEFVD